MKNKGIVLRTMMFYNHRRRRYLNYSLFTFSVHRGEVRFLLKAVYITVCFFVQKNQSFGRLARLFAISSSEGM